MDRVEDFIDPRSKLLILFITSICVFINKSIVNEVVFMSLPSILMIIYNKGIKQICKYIMFFITLCIIQIWLVPILPISVGGVVYIFTLYIRKLIPCALNGKMLLNTTKVSHFLVAISKLKLPAGVTISLAVGLRYFPTLKEEYRSIKQAMTLRGISYNIFSAIIHPIRSMEYIYVPILVSASRIGDEITQAAITRGIENVKNRESVIDTRFTLFDYLLWIIGVGIIYLTLSSSI